MKDLGAAKKILEMKITRDRSVGKLFLSQQAYVEKVLKRFNMNNAKPVTVLFVPHFKLSKDMLPKTDEEMEHISSVPYSSVVGSIMYALVCTRPDISHAVSVMSRYMACPEKRALAGSEIDFEAVWGEFQSYAFALSVSLENFGPFSKVVGGITLCFPNDFAAFLYSGTCLQ
ncbi:hypothetical protein GH714_023842 [Hevea brasiliensis]|uniref:Reverse transcriptase Ty1/copia-type domain-containing protein n=1 Tax=Hevea brasiliensis TaxID=3981 RepID=A0A6A6LMB1_HEVBR|nr:hypothetical protein GH714_023842 [Hevea brasiliensis]